MHLKAVNDALNNNETADVLTIVNFGTNYLSKEGIKLFLGMKEDWSEWGLSKSRQGSRSTMHYDFLFNREDKDKIKEGIDARRDKTSPIDLNNSDVLLKIPSTTTIFAFFCKISSIFHLSKLQRTRGENNGCRTAFIHCAI
jgi:hypothetical protein